MVYRNEVLITLRFKIISYLVKTGDNLITGFAILILPLRLYSLGITRIEIDLISFISFLWHFSKQH